MRATMVHEVLISEPLLFKINNLTPLHNLCNACAEAMA